MKKIFQLILALSIILSSSCTNKSLMKYYYPINSKKEVKIYKYINPQNQESTEYWKVTTNPILKTILTESFDAEFNLYNVFEEKIEQDKAELLRYVDYENRDELNPKEIKATVVESQVFNSKKESYNYVVEYRNQYGRMLFKKKRQFLSFEKIEVQGKEYKTAKFKDEYFIEIIDQKEKYEFYQNTFYAEGIGMVKYERFIPTGEIRILELENILTEEEYRELKK